jgi:hypothetical protein
VKPLPILCLLGLLATAAFFFISGPAANSAAATTPARPAGDPAAVLPEETLATYSPLAMEEIFRTPAGPKGLEYTDKAKSLDGKKVQVTGHMVRHAHADPRVFLFAPRRMVLFQAEFGTADDLPPYALHVISANAPEGKAARYLRDEIRVMGTLQLGPRQEIDGRISHVRLLLDHVTNPGDSKEIPVLASLAMQPERLLNANRANGANPAAPVP